jgi:hypothetical protein
VGVPPLTCAHVPGVPLAVHSHSAPSSAQHQSPTRCAPVVGAPLAVAPTYRDAEREPVNPETASAGVVTTPVNVGLAFGAFSVSTSCSAACTSVAAMPPAGVKATALAAGVPPLAARFSSAAHVSVCTT